MFDREIKEFVPLRQLGWAFLLAWVFCVFYTNAAGGAEIGIAEAERPFGLALYYAALPLAASVATLGAIVIAEPHIGAPTTHRRLIVIAPVLTAISTPLMLAAPADPTLAAVLFAAGSVTTGVGSALMWVMWGEYYAVISRDRAELLAPSSAVSAALLVLLVSAMGGWVSTAVTSAFPLLSGLCFKLVWTPQAARAETRLAQANRAASHASAHRPLAGLGRTGLGIMAVFAIVSIAGMMYDGRLDGIPLQIILIFSALMMALVAVMAVSGPRRISMFFLYRWMCPTLVVGLAALILFGESGGIIAVAASVGGRFTFCLIAQIYFANYACAGRATPAQASSLGWLFVHAGDLLGVVTWLALQPIAATSEGLTWLSVGAIVVLVTVTMLVMGEHSSFLRAPEQDNQVEDSPPVTFAATDDEGPVPKASATNAEPETPPSQADARPTEDRIAELARAGALTPRETEVFALLAQGRSIPYIRDELIISRETAATHAKHIYAKLGVHSRQELIDLVHG